jgi:hypothetical protein
MQARATSTSDQSIDFKTQMRLAVDIASGMEALAQQGVVHGSLATYDAT